MRAEDVLHGVSKKISCESQSESLDYFVKIISHVNLIMYHIEEYYKVLAPYIFGLVNIYIHMVSVLLYFLHA